MAKSTLGSFAPRSMLTTVCRLTPNSRARASCSQAFLFAVNLHVRLVLWHPIILPRGPIDVKFSLHKKLDTEANYTFVQSPWQERLTGSGNVNAGSRLRSISSRLRRCYAC